jgi:hypothetical protein
MIRKVKCANYCWSDSVHCLRWVMNVAAPFLCPYRLIPSRDDAERVAGKRKVDRDRAQDSCREMPLHQQSAALGG